MKPRLKRVNGGRWHAYLLDCDCPGRYRKEDPHKLFGVTTALNAKAKPALVGWAGRVTAEYAIDHWAELEAMTPSQRLDVLKGVQFQTKTNAGLRGTQIHAHGQALAEGKQVYVEPQHRAEVEAYARFLDQWQIDAWAAEVPVAHPEHQYGGTADLFGLIGKTGERALIDVKTSNGVYSETALQCVAYRYAQLWQPDGPSSEAPMPEVDAVYVAHVRPDHVDLLPVEADDDAFLNFLYVLQVARDDAITASNSRIGAPLTPPKEEQLDD